ncbi:MAG: TRAP transporter substrate-binding protein [Deltaproteobacteria bacterium]|jgi:TRAP-type mannitol/chloroaromatic compound transport system substrate-binding protein|nr:TRAP transporter substrate-binding protein [Deltaproteobacteria bacterium]
MTAACPAIRNRLPLLALVFSLLLGLTALLCLTGCQEQAPPPRASENGGWASTESYTLSLATSWPTNYPIFSDSLKRLAASVATMSRGQLTIEIDSANKHKAPFGVLDMVKAGQYDMGHSASYYWKGKDSSTMFFTTMPFGMTAPEQYAWFYHGGGLELMQKVYARHGVYSYPGGNTGVQMGGWFRQEINRLDDLKGLKMRVPGFAGEILAKLGVIVTNIPPGELYTALDRGTIDALEWVGPGLDLAMGFHKIARFYYTGWHEPAAELQFLINKETFDSLPLHLQEILRVAMQSAALDLYARHYHASAENWATIRTDYPDVQVRSFGPEILTALQAANDQLLTARAADNPLFKEVRDSQQAYLTKVRAWTLLSDFAYLNAVEQGQDPASLVKESKR